MRYEDRKKGYCKAYKQGLMMVFIIFIFSGFILNLVKKDKTFSEQENRNLKTKPEFSINNLLYNKYTSQYETYFSDQFILRNYWINVKGKTENIIGKTENNDVYFGNNGYLIEKFKYPKEDDINERVKAINTFCEKNNNITKYIALIPNKVRVLEDSLPAYAPEKDQLDVINNFYSKLDKNMKNINAFKELDENKDKYIYYKTDHHWTSKGAYYGYRAICDTMGIKPKEETDYDIKKVSDDFYGTLYSKAGISNISTDEINVYIPKAQEAVLVNYIEEKKKSASMYSASALDVKDKYTVFFGGNHPMVKIKTAAKSDKKLLIIKDSYANCLVPFFTAHFSDIIMVDLRYYGEDVSSIIKDYSITDMLILYNVNTFFEDESILNISNYE